MSGEFLGKYRGTVVSNVDPLQQGRLQIQVPDVAGLTPATWAMPCVPIAGINMGMVALPMIGSGVWVEFEQGDPDHPIWVGCYWGSGLEMPKMSLSASPAVPCITLQTPLMNGMVISDVPGPTGGILLKTTAGAMISVSNIGIEISNGLGATIKLEGPTVNINGGALTIT
jgi:hypothetical protein